jgi:hypothetical protein
MSENLASVLFVTGLVAAMVGVVLVMFKMLAKEESKFDNF